MFCWFFEAFFSRWLDLVTKSQVFNLQSVLDIPNFKGTMKALTHEEAFFRIGRVEGVVMKGFD